MYKKLFVLLLLISSCPNPNSGSVVKYLPGFHGPLPFELETGYIGIGEEEEIQLFYYFIKSENKPKEDPLLLWLSGGPGCSSVTGLLIENGPLRFKVDGYVGGSPILLSTTYSWTKVANIIYLDQPVGTGFSYAKSQLLDTPSDSGEAKRINEFLRNWLSKHAEYISNPFYVGGDSYSGKVIPATVQEISQGNDLGLKPQINLQGYVLGNPVTDTGFESNERVAYAHGMGLISDQLFESLKRSCRGDVENIDPHNIGCLKHFEEYDNCLSRINYALIILPLCKIVPAPTTYITNYPVPSTDDDECYTYTDLIASLWVNDESVLEALHVVKGSVERWVRCSANPPYNIDIKSSVPYHMNNSIKGYRSLIYSGDHDLDVPFTSTQTWIRSLNYSIVEHWKPWMIHNQVGGYTETYANKMTFATVKGGGHTAEYKPKESFILFQKWITGQL